MDLVYSGIANKTLHAHLSFHAASLRAHLSSISHGYALSCLLLETCTFFFFLLSAVDGVRRTKGSILGERSEGLFP